MWYCIRHALAVDMRGIPHTQFAYHAPPPPVVGRMKRAYAPPYPPLLLLVVVGGALGRWPRQSCGGVVVGMMDGPALTCLARPHYCCCSSSSFIIVVLIPIKKTVCGPAGLIVSFLLRRPRRSCDCVEMLSSLKILFAYYCC